MLTLKPDEIDTNEKRSKYTVSVIGCKLKGVLFANAFAQAGFRVICTDPDQSLVKKLARGKAPCSDAETESQLKSLVKTDRILTSNDLKAVVSRSDIIILTLNGNIVNKKNPNYSEVENACKQIGAALKQGSIVFYEGVAGFGFINETIKELLENSSGLKTGIGFGLAYTPIHMLKGQPVKSLVDTELKVAANDKTSLNTATILLQTISQNIKQVNEIKTLELATLFMLAKQDTETALANELAIFCEGTGTDFFKVAELINYCDTSFYPAISDGDRNKYFLLDSAENLNIKLRLPALSRQINEEMMKHGVNLAQNALSSCGKALRRARVAVLGSVNPKTTVKALVKILETKGAKTNLFDPSLSEADDSMPNLKRTMTEAVEGTDCIILLSDLDQLKRLNLKKLKAQMKNPAVIIDLIGLIEPQKVEAEGFVYRGLGRGK